MRNRKKNKENTTTKVIQKPSVEYTTEELLELGKKLNVLTLARPLYGDSEDNSLKNKTQNSTSKKM